MQLPRKEGRWEGGSKVWWVKKGGNKSRDVFIYLFYYVVFTQE